MSASPATSSAAQDGEFDQLTRHSATVLAVVGVISIVAGILVIAYPDITLLALAIIAGINVLLLGLVGIVDSIIGDGDTTARVLGAVLGVLSVIAGLIVIRHPGESLLAIILVLGIFFVVDAIVEAVRALSIPQHRGMRLLGALADLVLGVLILSLPELSLATVAILIGIGFVIRGFVAVWMAIMVRRTRKALAASPEPA